MHILAGGGSGHEGTEDGGGKMGWGRGTCAGAVEGERAGKNWAPVAPYMYTVPYPARRLGNWCGSGRGPGGGAAGLAIGRESGCDAIWMVASDGAAGGGQPLAGRVAF
jgi:hypothetical protein